MGTRELTPDIINNLKSASVAEQARLYIKFTKLHRVAVQNVWFNQQCKRQNIIPNYINIRSNTFDRSARLAIRKAQSVWLDAESRRWFKIRDNLKLHIKILHTELVFHLHPVEFDLLDQKARDLASHTAHEKRLSQLRKINRLIQDQRGTTVVRHGRGERNNDHSVLGGHSFYPRVQNLTNIEFSNNEMSFLENGLKYNVQPKITSPLVEEVAVDIEVAACLSRKDNMVKSLLASELKKIKHTPLGGSDLRTLKSIRTKVRDNDLVVTKADKGNTIVVLNRDSYNTKVNNVIQSSDFEVLNSDPTAKYNAAVKKAVGQCRFLFSNEAQKGNIAPMNPQALVLYGLPKIHKDNVPIRPVVSYMGCPAYKLAKILNRELRQRLHFKPKYSLQNTLDLVNKIKDVALPTHSLLLSLDVDSMFTNIPSEETLGILSDLMERRRLHPEERDELLGLTRICMQQNYFKFNNTYYRQREGLAMGSPLSPLMADVFMDEFERTHIVGNSNIIYYYRYVDDIIICWTGSRQELLDFVQNLNNCHNKIKFKLELEQNNSINFLDLTITREHCRHEFEIYRKPTYTNVVIPATSCHPWQHKLAAFHSYVNRLMTVPLSPQSFKKELHTIYSIALANGYSRQMVDSLVNKKVRREVRDLLYAVPPQHEVHHYRSSLLYIGPESDKLARMLRNNDIHVAFRTNNTIRRAICNAKEGTDIERKSGVYKLVCDGCNGCYVGQTGRSFITRYKEHISAVRNNRPERSHFAKHLIDTGHQLQDGHTFQVLHTNNKGLRLNVLEQLEIIKQSRGGNIFNDQLNVSSSPLLHIDFTNGSNIHSSHI